MKKYFTKAGREVKMGDSLEVTGVLNTPFGVSKGTYLITIDEKNVEKLIKEGFLTVKEKEDHIAKFGNNKIVLTYDSKEERDEAFDNYKSMSERFDKFYNEVVSKIFDD